MKQAIILTALIFMLFSCNTYKLTDADLEWQPYKVGDMLVFESSKGELDTIYIRSITINTGAEDPLAIFPDKIQTLFVLGERELLKMHSGKYGSKIAFKIRLGDNTDLRYPGTILNLEKLNLDAIKRVTYNNQNCIKIKAEESRENLKNRPFDLRSIYYSKEYGYLSLEFKGNYIWKLKSFMRDGEKLFSCHP